jgi:hypothetical protein
MTGYFAATNLWTTNPAYFWQHQPGFPGFLGASNNVLDNVAIGSVGAVQLPAPWQAGSFTYVIPNRWEVGVEGMSSTLPPSRQVFSIDSNGTVTITKFGLTMMRYTNNFITNY